MNNFCLQVMPWMFVGYKSKLPYTYIARNVGDGKHWWITLKTALAKKILAIASLTNSETLLVKNVVSYQYVCDV